MLGKRCVPSPGCNLRGRETQARHAQLQNNATFSLIAIKGAIFCLGSLFDWTDISKLTGRNYLEAYEERPNKGRSLCDVDYSRDIWIVLEGPIERDPRNEHKQGSGHGRSPSHASSLPLG